MLIFKMALSNNQCHFHCLKHRLLEYISSDFWKSGPTTRNLPYNPDHCTKSGTTDKRAIPQLCHRCDLEHLQTLFSQTIKIFNISIATENVTECIRVWKCFWINIYIIWEEMCILLQLTDRSTAGLGRFHFTSTKKGSKWKNPENNYITLPGQLLVKPII